MFATNVKCSNLLTRSRIDYFEEFAVINKLTFFSEDYLINLAQLTSSFSSYLKYHLVFCLLHKPAWILLGVFCGI